jgi:predicted ArsR family transcriptional regulator
LISTIRSELGETAFSRVLQRRAKEVGGAYRDKLAGETGMSAKLAALAEIRSAEGYMARLEKLPSDGYLLIEDHCPICAAATVCQGFCSIELEIFKSLFDKGWQIERQDHLLSGARRCTYRITPASAPASQAAAN